MHPLILCEGTWNLRVKSDEPRTWADKGSIFRELMKDNNFDVIRNSVNGWEFPIWSTGVGGINPFTQKDIASWIHGSFLLEQTIMTYVPRGVRILCHSNGGHLVPLMCQRNPNIDIKCVISIGTPYRKDIDYSYVKAPWLHITSSHIIRNMWSWLGSLFDGRVGSKLSPFEGPNIETVILPDIDHSGLLDNPLKHKSTYEELIFPFLHNSEHK